MKKRLKYVLASMLMISMISCEKDDVVDVADVQELEIMAGESVVGEWIIESVSTTEVESGIVANDEVISGLLNIKSDGTYTHDFKGTNRVGAFTKLGTWEISSDNKVISLNNNPGDADGPMLLNVLSLTASNLSYELDFFEGSGKVVDGTEEIVKKNLIMNFTR